MALHPPSTSSSRNRRIARVNGEDYCRVSIAYSAEHACVKNQIERLQSFYGLEYSSPVACAAHSDSPQGLNRQVIRNDKQTGRLVKLVDSLQFKRPNAAENKSVPDTTEKNNAHRGLTARAQS